MHDDEGAVRAAFLQAPRHPPITTALPPEAAEELPAALPLHGTIGVDSRSATRVVDAWARTGLQLAERRRLVVHRLRALTPSEPPSGTARTAMRSDRNLLVGWFERLMADHPDDPTDLAYAVDDPLRHGGIVLWEVDGSPVAMAGRSRVVAATTRIGPVFEVAEGYADAVFEAACATATTVADHVLVLGAADDLTGRESLRRTGFEPVAERVVLGP